VYTKEDNDPEGLKVLNLSDLLNTCGIECTIDHYHANDNVSNWSFWVENQIKYCVASKNGYILLVCSEAMYRLLEETSDNSCIQMKHAHIDRLTLKTILGKNTLKFLPIVIDEYEKKFVPLCLQGKTTFLFPQELKNNVESVHQSMLDLPGFSSLRCLVATVSGQQEIPRPDNDLGKTILFLYHFKHQINHWNLISAL